MKLALDPAELRAAALALLADADVQDAVRAALPALPGAEPTHLSIASFARRWSVSRRTVGNWLRAGLPIVRIGRLARIPLVEADSWVAGARARRGSES